MSAQRFREPHFEAHFGNFREPLGQPVTFSLVDGRFMVPGTSGNRGEYSGSRFFPSLDGNRDQYRSQAVPR